MNRIYLGLFWSFPLMGFFWAFCFPYSGHIEDTKSVEVASVAICSPPLGCPPFWLKMTGLFLDDATNPWMEIYITGFSNFIDASPYIYCTFASTTDKSTCNKQRWWFMITWYDCYYPTLHSIDEYSILIGQSMQSVNSDYHMAILNAVNAPFTCVGFPDFRLSIIWQRTAAKLIMTAVKESGNVRISGSVLGSNQCFDNRRNNGSPLRDNCSPSSATTLTLKMQA